MKINKRTAVIVVDMQNDFCSSEGALARLGSSVSVNQTVAERLPSFLGFARQEEASVVWIKQTSRADLASPARIARAQAMGRRVDEVAATGSWGAELYQGLHVQDNDVVIEKTKYSSFVGTPLLNYLRARDISQLVVCGTAANVCVDSTARDAYMADFEVVIPRDLVGYTRESLAQSALENLDFYFAKVVDSTTLFANNRGA